MDLLVNLAPHLVNGIGIGLLFALIALGFMLIVGVMEVINLAHGSLFALGAYFAMLIIGLEPHWFGPLGDWYVGLSAGARYSFALVVAPILVGLVGMLLEVCLRGTYGKDPLFGLLLTFGAAMVIEELIRVGWGSGEQLLAGTARDQRRIHLEWLDLVELPFLCRRICAARDTAGVVVPRAYALRRDHQGRRPR